MSAGPQDVRSAPSDIEIRRVGLEAAGTLAALNAATFAGIAGHPWSVKDFEETLGDPAAIALLATDRRSGEPVGYALFRQILDEAELLSIGVIDTRRNQGVGGAVIKAGARLAKNSGARQIFLEVAEDNLTALHFYRMLGFAESGKRHDYYKYGDNSGSICAILMAASLPLSASRS